MDCSRYIAEGLAWLAAKPVEPIIGIPSPPISESNLSNTLEGVWV